MPQQTDHAPEHAALDAALDGDHHAVAAILADFPLNRLRALAYATQHLYTSAHNRALGRVLAAAGYPDDFEEETP